MVVTHRPFHPWQRSTMPPIVSCVLRRNNKACIWIYCRNNFVHFSRINDLLTLLDPVSLINSSLQTSSKHPPISVQRKSPPPSSPMTQQSDTESARTLSANPSLRTALKFPSENKKERANRQSLSNTYTFLLMTSTTTNRQKSSLQTFSLQYHHSLNTPRFLWQQHQPCILEYSNK